MSILTYSAITSLDGYVADRDGRFDWAAPDEEVHAAVNDAEREVGTYLYGRRMYEVMQAWQTMGQDAEDPDVIRDFGALWRAADKVVYSTTLEEAATPRTRIERTFAADAVRRLKEESSRPISVGGPTLAAAALRAGLVDEVNVYLTPIVVGGGTPWLPAGLLLPLRLAGERRFAGGVVHLRYAVAG